MFNCFPFTFHAKYNLFIFAVIFFMSSTLCFLCLELETPFCWIQKWTINISARTEQYVQYLYPETSLLPASIEADTHLLLFSGSSSICRNSEQCLHKAHITLLSLSHSSFNINLNSYSYSFHIKAVGNEQQSFDWVMCLFFCRSFSSRTKTEAVMFLSPDSCLSFGGFVPPPSLCFCRTVCHMTPTSVSETNRVPHTHAQLTK